MSVLRLRLISLPFAACAAFAPLHAKADFFGSYPSNRVARAWQGFYVGAHLGTTFANYQATLTPGPAGYSDSSSDVSYGLYGGYTMQWNMMVAGIEADLTGSLPDGSGLAGATLVNSGGDVSGTIRGRLGFMIDPFVVYGTAGLALADTGFSTAAGSDSSVEFGGVAGFGAEAEITSGVTARAEYFYTSYGSGTYLLGPLTAGNAGLDSHTLRIGIGYQF